MFDYLFVVSDISTLFRLFDRFSFRQVDPHGRGHRLHRAQHGHEARGGGDPVQDVLAKAPGWQDLQEELPHDDEGVLPRSSAANLITWKNGAKTSNCVVMIIIVDGLVSGADTEKLERHIFRMYDSNKVGGTLSLSGSRFLRNIVRNISIGNSNSDDIPNVGL